MTAPVVVVVNPTSGRGRGGRLVPGVRPAVTPLGVEHVAAVFSTLRRYRPATFEVTVDGKYHSLSGMLVAVGNGRSYGGGMKVCPDASLSDGLLEVCVVGAMGRAEFVRNFPRVFRGTHTTHPK